MSKGSALVQVLFALWAGVLFTQLAIDDSGDHLKDALMIGALGTLGFSAAYGILALQDKKKSAASSDS